MDYDIKVRVGTQESVFEPVPSRLLHDLFPPMFVRSFVHWYNLKEDHLEFALWVTLGRHRKIRGVS